MGVELYILRCEVKEEGNLAACEATSTLLDLPFVANKAENLIILSALDADGQICVPGKENGGKASKVEAKFQRFMMICMHEPILCCRCCAQESGHYSGCSKSFQGPVHSIHQFVAQTCPKGSTLMENVDRGEKSASCLALFSTNTFKYVFRAGEGTKSRHALQSAAEH